MFKGSNACIIYIVYQVIAPEHHTVVDSAKLVVLDVQNAFRIAALISRFAYISSLRSSLASVGDPNRFQMCYIDERESSKAQNSMNSSHYQLLPVEFRLYAT